MSRTVTSPHRAPQINPDPENHDPKRCATNFFNSLLVIPPRFACAATLTQLGHDALNNSGKERVARITTFLNVQLFVVMYEQFKGHALPPPPAIERQMEKLGVSPKQKERVPDLHEVRSIRGIHRLSSSGRLVKPGIAQTDTVREEKPPRKRGNGDGDGTDGLNLDPLFIVLLEKIPDAEKSGLHRSVFAGSGHSQ